MVRCYHPDYTWVGRGIIPVPKATPPAACYLIHQAGFQQLLTSKRMALLSLLPAPRRRYCGLKGGKGGWGQRVWWMALCGRRRQYYTYAVTPADHTLPCPPFNLPFQHEQLKMQLFLRNAWVCACRWQSGVIYQRPLGELIPYLIGALPLLDDEYHLGSRS